MRLLLYIAAAASAQTRITNWEEQHQRLSGCTSGKPKILVEDVSTETWTSVKAVVGDLLLALRGDEVLFVREVDGPADVTVVAS